MRRLIIAFWPLLSMSVLALVCAGCGLMVGAQQ